MTARRRAVRRVLAGVCLAGLVAGCQTSDPEPGPPVVLPTREPPSGPSTPEESATPSPTASESPQMAEPEANRAAEIYLEGRNFAESLYREDPVRYSPQLEEYFSGPYLDFWQQDLSYFSDGDFEVEGPIRVAVRRATQIDEESGRQTVALTACLDYSQSTTFDAGGAEVDRGFDYLIDTVYMERTSEQDWKADGANSEELSSLVDTDCEGM